MLQIVIQLLMSGMRNVSFNIYARPRPRLEARRCASYFNGGSLRIGLATAVGQIRPGIGCVNTWINADIHSKSPVAGYASAFRHLNFVEDFRQA